MAKVNVGTRLGGGIGGTWEPLILSILGRRGFTIGQVEASLCRYISEYQSRWPLEMGLLVQKNPFHAVSRDNLQLLHVNNVFPGT